MIDEQLITRKILLITRDLREIETLAQKDLATYLASPMDEVLAERYLERMIGRMIDINYHLLTELGNPPPADYFSSFTELAKLGVPEPEFARRIAGSTGLRDRLVHEYDDIDPEKVHQSLRDVKETIPEYLRRVRDFVGRRSE